MSTPTQQFITNSGNKQQQLLLTLVNDSNILRYIHNLI